MAHDVEPDEEFIDFPGYADTDAASQDEVGIPGLKPITLGPAVVKISYSGVKVLVDIHVNKIEIFSARDFPRMQLYPGHLKDSATLSYSALEKKITVSLEVRPAERVVVVRFSGSKEIVSRFPSKPIRIPYMSGPYPFPDVSGLRHPKAYTKPQVEAAIAEGAWHDQPARLEAQAKPGDATDLITMLGGGGWLDDVRAIFAHGAFATPEQDSSLDVLIAIGVRTSSDAVLVVDGGFGFFYKPGLIGPEYVGLFVVANTGIGAALEFSADLTCGLYWGSADRSQTALQAFGAVNGFIRVSAAALAEVALDVVISGSPHGRVCGVNFGGGLGEGFAAAAGVQGVREVHIGGA